MQLIRAGARCIADRTDLESRLQLAADSRWRLVVGARSDEQVVPGAHCVAVCASGAAGHARSRGRGRQRFASADAQQHRRCHHGQTRNGIHVGPGFSATVDVMLSVEGLQADVSVPSGSVIIDKQSTAISATYAEFRVIRRGLCGNRGARPGLAPPPACRWRSSSGQEGTTTTVRRTVITRTGHFSHSTSTAIRFDAARAL